MRVAFLFNHYLNYQVLHGAPFAFELSRLAPEVEVELLFSTSEALEEAKRIALLYPDQRCQFHQLSHSGLSAWIPRYFPSLHRPGTLLENRHLLASFDALIAPEKNYIILKALPAFRKIKFIGLRHGAGDRPVSFNKGMLKFDYLLVPGQSYFDRFSHELPENCCEIAGYPKFEVLEKLMPETPRFFNNGRPVVLYIPHFHPQQSSWQRLGHELLSFFAASDKYNLIFAPHARLFKHRKYHAGIGVDEFRNLPNVLIDTGSERSFDMSYTRSADIYIGDVSSQVYEFLYHRKRPCVFLNPNALDASQMNFWQFGPVIRSIQSLEAAMDTAQSGQAEIYAPIQDKYVNAAFASGDTPPSTRGATALLRFLKDR